ncbi:MAG: hypothetical protein RIR97_901, partial [Pseudomonadota bacterium]
APHDAAWVADNYVSETWLPVSPVTGKLDAFEWKVPLTTQSGLVIDPDDSSIDEVFLTLPPVAEKPSVDILVPAARSAAPAEPVPAAADLDLNEKALETEIDKLASAAPPSSKKPEPFFGHAPDDPGVKRGTVPAKPKSRLKLF